MNHGVTITAQIRIFGFKAIDQLEGFQSRVSSQRFVKQIVQALGAARIAQAFFRRRQRRQSGFRFYVCALPDLMA